MRNSLVVILLVLISAIYADMCAIEKEKICSTKGSKQNSTNSNNFNNNYNKFGSNPAIKTNTNYNYTDTQYETLSEKQNFYDKKKYSSKTNWDHITYVDLADNIEEYYMTKWSNEGIGADSQNTLDSNNISNSPEQISSGELFLLNEMVTDSKTNPNDKLKGRFLAKLLNFMELYQDHQLQEIYDF